MLTRGTGVAVRPTPPHTQDFIICIEMAGFAVVHHYIYSYKVRWCVLPAGRACPLDTPIRRTQDFVKHAPVPSDHPGAAGLTIESVHIGSKAGDSIPAADASAAAPVVVVHPQPGGLPVLATLTMRSPTAPDTRTASGRPLPLSSRGEVVAL